MSNASDTGLHAVVPSDHTGGDQRPPAAAPPGTQPEYDFHPLCTAFPDFVGEDEFEKSLADYQLHPERAERVIDLAVDPADGRRKIVDGRHHYLLCRRLGYPVRTRELDLPPEHLCEHVLAKNLNRRHLTPAQKSIALAATTEWFRGSNQHGLPVARRRSPEETAAAATQGEAALEAGLGRATLARASRVVRQAPELAPAVRDNTLSLKAAEAAIALPPEDRAEIARAADPSAVAKRKLAGRPKARPSGEPRPGDDRPVGVLGELPPRVVRQLRRHGAKTVGDLRGQLARGVKAGREMDHEHRDLLKKLLADLDAAGTAPPAAHLTQNPPADRQPSQAAGGAEVAAAAGEPVRDMLGREVPDALAGVFTRVAAEVDRIVALLQSAKKAAARLNAGGPLEGVLDRHADWGDGAESDRRLLQPERPFAVCPACDGSGAHRQCPTCAGKGWLSEAEYCELPEGLSQRANQFAPAGFLPGTPTCRPVPRAFVPAGPGVDANGRPIPPKLRDAFAGDKRLTGWAREADRLAKQVKTASNWCPWIMAKVHMSLERVANDLRDARPFVVCPGCRGERCAACLTSGFLVYGQRFEPGVKLPAQRPNQKPGG